MTRDWLFISFIASLAGAVTLLFILGSFRLSQRSDRKADRIIRDLEDESERVVRHGDQHPWMER